jgi:DNA gyrase subunit A
MSVFDLSAIQAQYILDTPLRRLTRYDRLELERERETLQAEIAELTAILESPDRLRELVSSELADVAKRFADPRRTVLLESGGAARTAAVPLEVADDPCLVLLSSAGLVARTATQETAAELPASHGTAPGPRAAHDAITAAVPATVRGATAVVTSLGRLIRISVLEIPALPPSAHSPGLAGGAPVTEFVALTPGETVVGLAAPDAAGAGLAVGTAAGVVKRVAPDYPGNASEFDVIALKDSDRVVGAVQLASEDQDLVFITSDGQLLRFGARSVRPQGRAASGMGGVRLSARTAVIWFGAVTPAAAGGTGGDGQEFPGGDPAGGPVVVTVAGAAGALPGTGAATVKVTPYLGYPAKGRATGGVRCHRFLKGEDALVLAWAGQAPARGATDAGVPVDLPPADLRRDGSGVRVRQPLTALGGLAPQPRPLASGPPPPRPPPLARVPGIRRSPITDFGGAYRYKPDMIMAKIRDMSFSGRDFSPGFRAGDGRQASMREGSSSAAPPTMKSRRGATSLPMSRSNMAVAAAVSSTLIRRRVRWRGSMVVSASWPASISPRPLYRCRGSFQRWPLRSSSSSVRRSSPSE